VDAEADQEQEQDLPDPSHDGERTGRRWQVVVAVAAAVVLVGALVVKVVDDGSSGADVEAEDRSDGTAPLPPGQLARRGDPLPELSIERHDGGTLQLAELEGRPAVINFFASWCAPCVAEMPEFEAVHQELGDEVTFVGVAATDDRDAEMELIERTGVTYETVRDPKGDVMTALGVLGLPATVLVGADGRIAEYHLGELDGQELRALVDEHLG
jgi:cytochrome c-type biogenesis protein